MITESCKVYELLAPATRTSSANGTGVNLATAPHRGDNAMVILHIGAVTGTAPTLDVKIQDSADNSSWADYGSAFAQKAAAGVSRMNVDLKGARQYVRAVATIGGTTPSFPCSVVLVAEHAERPVAAQA